ncbi:MAG: Nif3-like dinuclear metal center hexameric protein [Gammaproteobacteria bacterium]|nr:Nif3-like dinuclear metal center hexameric protein [Gammaproteobacteria bacterium]
MNNFYLENYLNKLLQVSKYHDYSPNGLQVEGRKDVSKVVCGVTASMDLIREAINWKADAIIVHHGYFWKGEQNVITHMKQKRIKALLEHDINMYGYHLPLDGHEVLGNNAHLAEILSAKNAKPIAPFELLWTGEIEPASAEYVGDILSKKLGRLTQVIKAGNHEISKIAWCSGGAQGFLEQAALLGVDAYISGEISEKTYHEAKEYGVHYFAAGHHATECGGIRKLAEYISANTELECKFINCHNPV